ncbi:hypothetical protein R3P38DRAFT_2772294 [Favolaschia claudopus]|uniref:Uncharacterized protein n=1 Tax=Favolaschia claudopus TaxID=2862362 RepID=A0AAW0C562_9AGAR
MLDLRADCDIEFRGLPLELSPTKPTRAWWRLYSAKSTAFRLHLGTQDASCYICPEAVSFLQGRLHPDPRYRCAYRRGLSIELACCRDSYPASFPTPLDFIGKISSSPGMQQKYDLMTPHVTFEVAGYIVLLFCFEDYPLQILVTEAKPDEGQLTVSRRCSGEKSNIICGVYLYVVAVDVIPVSAVDGYVFVGRRSMFAAKQHCQMGVVPGTLTLTQAGRLWEFSWYKLGKHVPTSGVLYLTVFTRVWVVRYRLRTKEDGRPKGVLTSIRMRGAAPSRSQASSPPCGYPNSVPLISHIKLSNLSFKLSTSHLLLEPSPIVPQESTSTGVSQATRERIRGRGGQSEIEDTRSCVLAFSVSVSLYCFPTSIGLTYPPTQRATVARSLRHGKKDGGGLLHKASIGSVKGETRERGAEVGKHPQRRTPVVDDDDKDRRRRERVGSVPGGDGARNEDRATSL